jgi:hypothetical protein
VGNLFRQESQRKRALASVSWVHAAG